jgi:hypothetical protein
MDTNPNYEKLIKIIDADKPISWISVSNSVTRPARTATNRSSLEKAGFIENLWK